MLFLVIRKAGERLAELRLERLYALLQKVQSVQYHVSGLTRAYLPFCHAPGAIRTLTLLVLNQVPLPIGVRRRIGAAGGFEPPIFWV